MRIQIRMLITLPDSEVRIRMRIRMLIQMLILNSDADSDADFDADDSQIYLCSDVDHSSEMLCGFGCGFRL